MSENKKNTIEMYYTLTCPNCKILEKMLKEVLPQFEDKFEFKKTLASGPIGYIKSLKLGIHSVPTLLINDKIIFRSVPSKEDLIKVLQSY